jgi:hypothetical protein
VDFRRFLVEMECIDRPITFLRFPFIVGNSFRDQLIVIQNTGDWVIHGQFFLNFAALDDVNLRLFDGLNVQVCLLFKFEEKVTNDAMFSY